MMSPSLSALDPTLIDGVRDRLADDFAHRIFDAIPDISDCIEFEAEACASVTGKKRFERAAQLLCSRRRDLESRTAAVVRRIFDERLYRLVDGIGRSARLSLDSMTMLTDEGLDEEIAINHCSRRLKEQCEYELWGLTRRIVVLTGVSHPADNQNPVFPQTFAHALMEAIGSLETDAGVRMIVFKTFGPVLLDIVPAVYTTANSALTARGIDVEIAEYYGRPVVAAERQSAPSPTPQEIALGAAKVNLQLTAALKQILSNPLPIVQPDEATKPAWHGDLRDIARATDASTDQSAGTRTLHDARVALQEKLTRDEQVIGDIITVMFGRLLADPRMPVQLRGSVARLQLPVLELALRDRSLLTQAQHPVRKLIDLIAEFGLAIGIHDHEDSTVRSVASIVDGLILMRNEEPNAFRLAFDQLDGLFYHHEEAALLTDPALRALERLEVADFAGGQADREIALRLQNLTLPVAISAFILTAWRDVLVHGYLFGGPKGDPWKLGLATLDDIVKSLRPTTTETERRRLVNILPASIELLLYAPDAGIHHGTLAVDFFAELHRAHQLAISGNWAEIGGEKFVPSPVALAVPSSVTSPSALLAGLGMACGDWIETRDVGGTRRWRLNWLTSIFGTCVFKHYESSVTCNMSWQELRDRLASGAIQQVRGLGLADDVLNSAFETVSRKARREQAIGVPGATDRGALIVDAVHARSPALPGSPPIQTLAMGAADQQVKPDQSR